MTPSQKRMRDLRDRQSRERGRMAELARVDSLKDEQSVPIRLSPIPTTSRVLPIPRVKLGLGRAAISPAMSSAS